MAGTCSLATSKAFQDGVDSILVFQKVGQNLTKYWELSKTQQQIETPLGELPVKCKCKCKFMYSFQGTKKPF